MDQLIPQRFTNFTSSVHTQTVSASYITLSFAALEDQAHGSYAFPLCPPCVPITVGPWTWRGEHIDYLFHRLSTNSTPAALPFPWVFLFYSFLLLFCGTGTLQVFREWLFNSCINEHICKDSVKTQRSPGRGVTTCSQWVHSILPATLGSEVDKQSICGPWFLQLCFNCFQ